jgi:fructan beta-fructosidase
MNENCRTTAIMIRWILTALIFMSLANPLLGQEARSTSREFPLTKKYLIFPVSTGSHPQRVAVQVDGKTVREFDVELSNGSDVDLRAHLDVTPFQGKQAVLTSNNGDAPLDEVVQADELPQPDSLYDERLRPQFHFSQRIGWNNDPNGLVYYDGEWHLFFQHNPYGWNWGNMHWGHAVSPDLVHWKQLPIAIYNNKYGDWAFSGGAVVDENNTTGFQQGDEKVIVASYTSTKRGECLAYSNDRGRTFVDYEHNPVVRHNGRDPKIIWYAPGQHWVMAVYDEPEQGHSRIAFYSSTDMKRWKFESTLPGYFECPEIFELPVDGDPNNTRWVIFAADAKYTIGSFDGKTFVPEHKEKHEVHYGPYYASQTYNNAPDGRRIQIGWAKIDMPEMPFNQTFSFPHELSLRTTNEGIRMFAEPVHEIELLHRKRHAAKNKELGLHAPFDLPVSGELFDIRATFDVGTAAQVGLDIGGNLITYKVDTRKLNGAGMHPVDGKISLQVLVDRPMIEICGNHGRVAITSPRESLGELQKIQAFAKGGEATLESLEVFELASIWKDE